jgi:hypothetical protein
MGLTNKIATKIRTKDHLEAIAIGGDWDKDGALIAAAIVRGAVCALGSSNVTSSAFRGRDVLGINATRSTRASTIWYEQSGSMRWSISLGTTKFSYQRVLDWQLQFDIMESPTGRQVNVSTPAQSTHDGTLMNKNHFMESRDLVLTGFRLGRSPNVGGEEQLFLKSKKFNTSTVVELNEGVERQSIVIRTILSLPRLNEVLDALPSPTIEKSEIERRVRVGASGPSVDQFVQIALSDGGEFRQVRVKFDIAPCGPVEANIVNVKHAVFLAETVNKLIDLADPGSENAKDERPGGEQSD